MSSDLFITEIDSTRRLNEVKNLDLLENVRKDHKTLKDVVDAFKYKVDKLIDKQRQEYVQAYETHIQDVQKELHTLREKVFQIANDDTKTERTEKLKVDLQNYKAEAIELEEDSDELRSTMAALLRKLYSAEKSRDWFLKKLRSEKKRYNNLLKERMRIYEEGSSMAGSLDNTSGYTLEIVDQNPKRTNTLVNNKFKRGIRGHATVNRDIHLPKIQANNAGDSRPSTAQSVPDHYRINQEEHSTQLLALRARMQELRDFISRCKGSLHRRPWNRVEKRNYRKLLEICQNINEAEIFPSNKDILPIVCELAASPQVYEVVEDMLGSVHNL